MGTRISLGLLLVAGILVMVAVNPVAPRGPDLSLVSDQPVTIIGAGDIATGGTSTEANAVATGDLIRASQPNAVVTLGDNAYEDGTLTDYQTKYDPAWGSFKAITHPTPGNHEYDTGAPTGYLDYFGTGNVTNAQDGGVYYAWDVGNGWRAYSLNSQVSMSTGSAQELWLRNDLAAHPDMHYLAYLHYPRYSSGTVHGDHPSVCPLWNDLMAAGADLMLAGHDHSYERWTKMDCAGNASASGIREFKVGTGGNQLYPFGDQPATLEFRQDTDYGVLELVLHQNSYDWAFLASDRGWNGSTSVDTTDKGAVLDSGSAATNLTLGTGTPTATDTGTATATATGTATPTQTPTQTPSETPSQTPSETPSETPSQTPSETPSQTIIPTLTPTATGTGSTAAHFVAHDSGSSPATTTLGYDLHDTSMTAKAVDSVPSGTQAMVKLAKLSCTTSLPSKVTSFVSAQASNPRIYGYFVADRPSDTSSSCVAVVRAMADYIHAHAPGQQVLIELSSVAKVYQAYAPANSHADLVAINPSPCKRSTSTCNFGVIDQWVSAAVAAGIPRGVLVPTFQVYGDSTYRPPTVTELQAMLAEWQEELPTAPLDYSYSWGCKSGSLTDCLQTHPEWQQVMTAYLTGSSQTTSGTSSITPSTSPSTSPTSTPAAPGSPTCAARGRSGKCR